MVTFIGEPLGPVFEAAGFDTLIVAPDTAHLSNLPPRAEALIGNANVMKYLDGISTYPYMQEGVAGLPDGWSLLRENNLFFWQTEISGELLRELQHRLARSWDEDRALDGEDDPRASHQALDERLELTGTSPPSARTTPTTPPARTRP